jgi:hypothetical protein
MSVEPERVRLLLEIDPDEEPIAGKLTGPSGEVVPFHGWIALTALLESSRTTALDARPGVAGEP